MRKYRLVLAASVIIFAIIVVALLYADELQPLLEPANAWIQRLSARLPFPAAQPD